MNSELITASKMRYTSVNEKEKNEMLKSIGVQSTDELFSSIDKSVRIKGLNLATGLSELELLSKFENFSKKNVSLKDIKCFRGAGIYEHFIPSLVEEIISRSEFLTAYTPYQAEASQGTLQAIFEYQSLLVELTGLDV